MDGNNLSKFRLNTIKSIHLLDEDKEFDHAIIVDLKNIINKYRNLGWFISYHFFILTLKI